MTEEFQIRDRRNGQWAWINNAVIADPHLTPAEKLVYAAMATFAGYDEIKPSVPTLRRRCSLSIRKIQTAIRRLEDVGYLQVERRIGNGPSVYYLLKAAKGCHLCQPPQNLHPRKICTPAEFAGDPRKKQHKTPAEFAPNIDKDIDREIDGNKPSAPDGGTNGNPSGSSALKAVRRVWDYYIATLRKNPNLLSFSDTKKQKGLSRFAEAKVKTGGDPAKAEELMKLVVDAVAASDHHMGKNDEGKPYNSWEKNLFPSLEKFEWWLERVS